MGCARESQEPGNTGCSDRVMCLVGLKDCPRELEICSVRDGDRVNHTCILELYFSSPRKCEGPDKLKILFMKL